MAYSGRNILIAILLLCVVVAPIADLTSPAEGAAPQHPPPNPPQPYVPSGIPAEELSPETPLTHLNIRLPAQDPDQVATRLAAIMAAAREEGGAAGPTALPPEITLLAAGLDNDPALIFDYVRNNYGFLPSWGLLKSPVETILAKAGNPFDQAALLAALLQAAGYETRYVVGTVRMPVSTAMNWAGILNQDVLWYAFAGGGIPSQVTGGNLRLNHVWVKVKVGGTWHPLDPSFKSYASTAGVDLPAIIGHNRTDFVNAAQSGSTVAADYVQRINEAQLQGRLTTYATNLLNHLRTNAPAAPLAEVIGGRAIVAQTTSTLPTVLPYTVESVAGEVVTLPDSLAFKLRVQTPGLDHEVKLTDIAGQRVTLFHVAATPADQAKIDAAGGIYNVYPAYSVNMKPELRIGGTLAATGSALMLGATERVTITLRTPWLDSQSKPLDFGFVRTFWSSNWYALALRLGDMSDAALSGGTDRLAESLAAGVASGSEPALGQALHCLGMAQHSEYGHLRRLAAQVGGTLDSLNLGIMVVAQDTLVEQEASGQQRPLRIKVGSYYVDAQLNLGGVNSITGDANRERGYMAQIAWAYSAAEGAIMEQLQGNPGLSTVRVLDLANRQGLKIYRINKTNFATIIPLLTYSSSIKNQLINDARAGYDVIVPERNVTLNAWTGTGWRSYDPNSGSMGTWLNGSLAGAASAPVMLSGPAAQNQEPPTASEVSPMPEPISGGSGSQKGTIDYAVVAAQIEAQMEGQQQQQQVSFDEWGTGTSPKKPDAFEPFREFHHAVMVLIHGADYDKPSVPRHQSEPIDVVTGEYLYDRTDLSYGSRGLPTVFARTYSSAAHNRLGPLGWGWSHAYALRLDTASFWARAQGDRPAQGTTAAIAGIYATLDIATTAAGSLPHAYLTIGSEATDWTVSQGLANARVLARGDGGRAHYLRLPDGAYYPSDIEYSQLTFDASSRGTLRFRDGSRLQFDASGRLTGLKDPPGNLAALAYDAQGRLIRVTDPVERSLTFAYTGDRLTQLTDPAGRVFRYEYDARGNLVRFIDPAGRTRRYEYDAAGRMTGWLDADGVQRLTNEYDALGRVARQTTAIGGDVKLRYGDGRTVMAGSLGQKTIFTNNRRGWLTGMTDPLGASTTWDYDARGNFARTTDARGAVTTYTHDAHDNLLRTVDPRGQTWAYGYDADDNLVSLTDPLGNAFALAYDARKNLLSITDPSGGATQWRYDAYGQWLDRTDPLGHKTAYQYSDQGDIIKITDALGHATRTSYDILSRPITRTDANGHATTFTYDPAGNLARSVDALGAATAYTYTGQDQVASMTDPLGRVTRYEYNALMGLIRVVDAAGGVMRYAYDADGRLIGKTDAAGHTWAYALDAAGRLQRATDPLGHVTEYTRDPAGAVTTIRRADGSTIQYGYDLAGQPISITYPDGTTVALTRDAAGALIEAAEPGQRAQYTRDALGRVTLIRNQGPDYELAYAYDAAYNRTGLTMTSAGQTVLQLAYTHDAADRLTRLTDVLAGQSVDYTYDAADNLLSAGSNGARTTYRYDAADRVSGATGLAASGATLFDRSYTLDAAGNLTRLVEAGPGARTEDFRYTVLDQLAEVKGPRATTAYEYDALGNRSRADSPLGPVDYTHDAAGQLAAAGDTTFTYDALGRRSGATNTRGLTTYTYGRDNRLAGIDLPWGEQWRYGYDFAGRRTRAQGPAGTRRFAYDGWLVIAEQGAEGRWEATYAYGPAGLATRQRANVAPALATTAYHADGQGNIAALTDAAGAPRAIYRHDPFGVSGRPAGLDPNPYGFVGAWGVRAEEAGVGLYLMGNRIYDAATGQFLTRDPLPGTLFDPLGQNPYGYARGNPLRYLDPLGLQSDVVIGEDGSASFSVGGQEVTIPSSDLKIMQYKASQTTGTYG